MRSLESKHKMIFALVQHNNQHVNRVDCLLGCFSDVPEVSKLLGVSHTFLKGERKSQTSQGECLTSRQPQHRATRFFWLKEQTQKKDDFGQIQVSGDDGKSQHYYRRHS